MIKLLAIATTLLLVTSVASICDNGCIKCSPQNACLMCDFTAGYFLENDGCSFKMLSNCLSRSISGNCLLCQDNYYIDLQQKKCVLVPSTSRVVNCKYYSSATTCFQCNTGFYISDKKCLKVETPILNCANALGPSLCQECSNGYILSADNKKCLQIKTTSFCMIYSSVDCKKCKSGYSYNINALLYIMRDLADSDSLVNNASAVSLARSSTVNQAYRCSKISLTNCKMMQNFETCLECYEGYFVDTNGNCTKNPTSAIPNCSVYLSIDTCVECSKDYYLASSNVCSPITAITNCYLYDTRANTVRCLQCESQFFLSQNSCVARNVFPELCSALGVSFDGCEKCAENYSPTTDKSKCLASIKYCEEYTTSSSSDTVLSCARCRDRFYSLVSSCELGTTAHCLTYISNKNQCNICEGDYYLASDNTCQLHRKTIYCNTYSNYVANQCDECNSRSIKLTVETECNEIYIEGCVEHQNENLCKICDDGYNNSQGVCVLIGTEYNCRRQVDGRCVLCKEGYLLDNAECTFPITNFNKNCLKNNIDGLIGDQNKECLICNNGSIFYNYKNHYECLEKEYVKATYNITLNNNCAGYMITAEGLKCSKCSVGMFLRGNTCVTSCDTLDAIRPYDVQFEFVEPKYSINAIDKCFDNPNNCKVEYPVVPPSESGILSYSCESCQSGYNFVVNLRNKSHLIAKGEHTFGDVGKNKFTLQPIGQCDNSTKIRTTENSHCKLFYHLIDDTLGCLSCEFGYSGLVKNFVVNNCHKYDDAEEKCVKCQQGYFLENSYVCTPIVPIEGCDLYSITANTSYCVKCKTSDPIYFLENGTCTLIVSPVLNCDVYSVDSEKCEICKAGFRLNEDATVCYAEIQNCKIYEPVPNNSTIPLCNKCEYRHILALDFKTCVAEESNINCWEYANTGDRICIHHNKIPFIVTGECESPTIIKGCLKYNDDDVKKCVNCDETKYYLHQDTCVSFGKYLNASKVAVTIPIEGCLISKSTTGITCTLCGPDRYHVIDTAAEFCCVKNSIFHNGTCLKVTKMEYNTLNCEVYDPKMNLCILCKSNFYLNEGICCEEGKYLDSTSGICNQISGISDLTNCLRIDPSDVTECLKCKAGYEYTNGGCCNTDNYWNGTTCSEIPENCLSVDLSGKCTSCVEDYYISIDTCCPFGQYYSTVSTGGNTPGCKPIPQTYYDCSKFDGINCIACNNDIVLDPVTKICCSAGNIYIKGACVPAENIFLYCEKYSSTSEFVCEECAENSYLFNGVCSSTGSYIKFTPSYIVAPITDLDIFNCAELDSDLKCVKCNENSYVVAEEAGSVTCCIKGTVWYNELCVDVKLIFDNCAQFNWTTYKCEVCYNAEGYETYLHRGICVRNGYFFTESGLIDEISIDDCSKLNDEGNCIDCFDNYVIAPDANASTINPCVQTSCKVFNGEDCIECDSGSMLEIDSGECVTLIDYAALPANAECNFNTNYCKSYSAADPCKCLSCKDYTYLIARTDRSYCCRLGHTCSTPINEIPSLNKSCAIKDVMIGCKNCYLDEDLCNIKSNTKLIAKNVILSDGSYKVLSYVGYPDYEYFLLNGDICCKLGYYSLEGEPCREIPIKNCAALGENRACAKCKDEYVLTSGKSCCRYDEKYNDIEKVCMKNHSITDCLTGYYKTNNHCCKKTYYWNKITEMCEPLLDIHCEESDYFGFCNKCASGYIFDSTIVYEFNIVENELSEHCSSGKYPLKMNLCVETGSKTNTSSLPENYLLYSKCESLNLEDKTCTACSSETYKNVDDNICCESNFLNTVGYCTRINTFIDGCVNYSNTDKKCLECSSGYSLQRGVCCKSGYFLDLIEGKCSIYEPYCDRYNHISKFCYSCKEGAYLQNSVCCPFGTFFDSTNQKCEASSNELLQNCSMFNGPNTCITCNEDSGYYFSSGACCNLGTYSDLTPSCAPIEKLNCGKKINDICTQCITDDYTLQDSGDCCLKTYVIDDETCVPNADSDTNCEYFRSMNTCAKCKTTSQREFYVSNGRCCEVGLYLPSGTNGLLGICLPINDNTKKYCNQIDQNVCTSCKTGYYLQPEFHICCAEGTYWNGTICAEVTNIENCLQTYDDVVSSTGCIKCKADFVLVSGACIDESNFVTDCLEGEVSNNIKICTKCTTDKHPKDDGKICCKTSGEYYNEITKTCVAIINCDLFDYTQNRCIICSGNNYLALNNPDCCQETKWYDYSKGTCESIATTECLRLTSNRNAATVNCSKCVQSDSAPYYYYDESENSTIRCKAHTKTCSKYDPYKDSCLSCSTGYYFDDTTANCLPHTIVSSCSVYDNFSDDCLQCENGKVPEYTDLKLTLCKDPVSPISHCNVYNSSEECIKCAKSYYLSNELCVLLTAENCKLNHLNLNECNECENDFYVSGNGNACTPRTKSRFSDNCLERSAQHDNCLKCVSGFNVSPTGGCISSIQIDHCKLRSKYYDYCEICEDGYISQLNSPGTDISINECVSSTSISERVLGCVEYDDELNCIKCNNVVADEDSSFIAYYLSIESNECLVVSVVLNCKVYFGPICVKCQSNYYLDGIRCKKSTEDDNCAVYNTHADSCSVCKNGYYSLTNKCVEQTPVPDCDTYDLTNGNCRVCKTGYYFNATTKNCVLRRQIPLCKKTKRTEDKCEFCNDGHYKKTISGVDFCVEYPKINFCTVFDDDGFCKDCAPGYYLNDKLCLPLDDDINSNCRSVGYYGFYCADGSQCSRKYVCDNDVPCEFKSECSGLDCIIGEKCADNTICKSNAVCSDNKPCDPYDICSDGSLCPVKTSCGDGSTCKVKNLCDSNDDCLEGSTCENGESCADEGCSEGTCEKRPICSECRISHYLGTTVPCSPRSITENTDCMILSNSSDTCEVCKEYKDYFPSISATTYCAERDMRSGSCPVLDFSDDKCEVCFANSYKDQDYCSVIAGYNNTNVYDIESGNLIGCKDKSKYFDNSSCNSVTTISGCMSYSLTENKCVVCTKNTHYFTSFTCQAYSFQFDASVGEFDDQFCSVLDPNNNICLEYNDFFTLVGSVVKLFPNCSINNGDTCTSCSSGYVLSDEYECTPVTFPNCKKNILNEQACAECEDDYYLTNQRCCAVGKYYKVETNVCADIPNESWLGCKKIDDDTCIDCFEEDGYYLSKTNCCLFGTYFNTESNICVSISQTEHSGCTKLNADNKCIECESTKYLIEGKCCLLGNFWDATSETCKSNSGSTDINCKKFSSDYSICAECNDGFYLSGLKCCGSGSYYNGTACAVITDDTCEQYVGKICTKCSTDFSDDGKCCLGNGTVSSRHYDETAGCIKNAIGCHDFNKSCLYCRGSINSANNNYLVNLVINNGLGCCAIDEYYKPSTNTCIAIQVADRLKYGNCILAEELNKCLKCKNNKVIREGTCTEAGNFSIDGTLLPFTAIKNICKQLAHDGKCLACNTGYYSSNGICCRVGDYLDGTTCEPIGIPVCSEGDGTKCTKCDEDFFLNVDGSACCAADEAYDGNGCIRSPILNCVDVNVASGICNKCAPGFTKSDDSKHCCGEGYAYIESYGACKNILRSSENCYSFDRTNLTCMEKGCKADEDVFYLSDGFCCLVGFIWNRETENCEQMTEKNCDEYNTVTKGCQKCHPDDGDKKYYLLSGKCCNIGTYWNPRSKSCTDINIPHCKKYDGNTKKCLDCGDLYLYNGMCCPESYFYGPSDTNLMCKAPIKDCSLYNQDGTCKECTNYKLTDSGTLCCPADTFYDHSTNSCIEKLPIPLECEQFDPANIHCIKCTNGYQLYGKTCCPYGKYFNASTQTCDSISADFSQSNCDVYSLDDDVCTKCSNTHYLDDSDECVQKPTNCTDVDESGKCQSCTAGYYLTNDRCCQEGKYYNSTSGKCETISVVNCVQLENTGICMKCAVEHYLVSEACCANGSYYDGNNCVVGSIDYCLEYTDVNNCSTCQSKYATYQTAVSGSNQTKCFPISIENCVSALISTETLEGVEMNSISCDQCLRQGTSFVRKEVTPYFKYMEFRSFDSTLDNPHNNTDGDNCLNYDITNLLSSSTFKCKVCEKNELNYSNKGVCAQREVENLNKCTKYNETEDLCTECDKRYYLDSGICVIIPQETCSKYDPENEDCRVCISDYSFTYKTENGKNGCSTDYGITAAKKPLYYSGYIEECTLMNECSSVVYEGLGAELNLLFSCHKCKKTGSIPFVSVSGGNSMESIIGIQQYFLTSPDTFDSSSLGASTSCVAPVASSFNLSNGTFNFPTNCALGMINADLEASAVHSINPEVTNTDQLSIFCVACKPGFRPYKSDSIAYYVWKCEQIENCVDFGRIDGCARCDLGFKLKYTDDKGVDYMNCVSNNDANCYAAYDSRNAGKCGVCKEGYTVNPDGLCEILKSLFCDANNFSLIKTFKITDLEPIIRNNVRGIGCHSCNIGYVPVLEKDENYQCTRSDYVYGLKYLPDSAFDPNCYVYMHIRDNNVCQSCNVNFILTQSNRCIPINTALDGCSVAVDFTTCKSCQTGYSLINRKCAFHNKSNCLDYDDYPESGQMTCRKCNSGFYLENNNCFKGKILDCTSYTSKDVCDKCADGLALVILKNKETACYPVSSHPNCTEYTNDFNNGRVVCSSCAASNFQLRYLEVPVKVCDPVRLVDFCIEYDIQSSFNSSTLACTLCSDGYYLINKQCLPRTIKIENCLEYSIDSQICIACSNSYYLNITKTQCIEPPTGVIGCRVYESATKCKYCENRKYLEGGKCINVANSVVSTACDVFLNATDCGICASGYFLQDKQCVIGVAKNCATFKSPTECATCAEGYVLPDTVTATGTATVTATDSATTSPTIDCIVKTFVQNCLVSTNASSPVCTECNADYYLDSTNTCNPVKNLIPHCEFYKDLETCSSCLEGFIMTTNGKECLPFSANDACTNRFFLDSPICSVCSPGYKLNESNLCSADGSLSSLSGCSFTDPSDPTTCVICKSGYRMTSTSACVSSGVRTSPGVDADESSISVLRVFVMLVLFYL